MSHRRREKQRVETRTHYQVSCPGNSTQVVRQSQITTRVTEPSVHRPQGHTFGIRCIPPDRTAEERCDVTMFTSGQMLHDLDIDRSEVGQWEIEAERAFAWLSKDQRRRGAGLLYSDSFRNFLKSPDSGILVVHANDDENSLGKAWSCLSAPMVAIYDWLFSQGITLSIPFFCGDMREKDGSTPGVIHKMLRLIISGVVCLQADGDHTFPGLGSRRLGEMDMSYLSTVMKILFKQTMDSKEFRNPDTKALDVTVLIDGAQYLETRDNLNDFRRVMDAFKEVVKHARRLNKGDVFKVVLLFPERSSYTRTLVTRDELLEIKSMHIERARKDGTFESAADLPNLLNKHWVSRGSH